MPAPTTPNPSARVIFDTDPGIDDIMALLFAHRAAAIELVGITTVVGNGTITDVTRNALYACEQFGIDVPVHQGAGEPLQVASDSPPDFVHGADAMGNVAQAPKRNANSTDAAQFIIDTVRAAPGQITLLAVGRLTNLATALARAPDIAALTAQVVIMGGALGTGDHRGNVTPVAEANIYGDPHAADMVFTAAWPVTMVGLDVTMEWFMPRQWLQKLCNQLGTTGTLLWNMTRFYDAFYAASQDRAGFPVHDSSAVAWLLAPEHFRTTTGALRVVTEGVARGQTIMVPADQHFPENGWTHQPQQQACVGVDADALLELFAATLTG